MLGVLWSVSWLVVSYVVADTLYFTPHGSANVTLDGPVICPGKKTQCEEGTTCCKMVSGLYGCCPMPQAVCCSDHIHCCPKDTKCNIKTGSCLKSNGRSINWLSKVPAKPVGPNAVTCGDKKSTCPDGATCCKLQSGQYGCCPLPKAVCCSDHVHCCPSGSTCDVKTSQCRKKIGNGFDISIPWYTKLPADTPGGAQSLPANPLGGAPLTSVICPGGERQCPNGNTCCKRQSGEWACCPVPKAVCCSDFSHCCPEGYKCDVKHSTCTKGNDLTMTWSDMQISYKVQPVRGVICPGGKMQCATGQTCCKLASGQYGCCPYPSATCCSDHLHCCPNGYTCDVATATCNQNGKMKLISVIQKAQPSPFYQMPKANDVDCPDKKSTCPSGTTCCQMQSGEYGCCPFEDAVCCSDHLHCCPKGQKCDTKKGSCVKNNYAVPWSTKFPAHPRAVGNVKCEDQKFSCPDGMTCCKLPTGKYACCPLKKAVCCSDGIHCCPSGTTCDLSTQSCISSDTLDPLTPLHGSGGEPLPPWENDIPTLVDSDSQDTVPLTSVRPSAPVAMGDVAKGTFAKENKMVGSIICPDRQSMCPDGSTCCKLQGGEFGCCPLPRAVCCPDHQHCCPGGYQCDIRHQACLRHYHSLPWLKKQQAKNVPVTEIKCPDGIAKCPDQTTCCKLRTGEYGCCPLEKAVCCKDGLSCCPQNTKCNVTAHSCESTVNSLTFSHTRLTRLPLGDKNSNTKLPLLKLFGNTNVGIVKCPDGIAKCPDKQTCCKLQTGEYGCCPLEQAVCCKDGLSCCPQNTKCNVTARSCESTVNSLTFSHTRLTRLPLVDKSSDTNAPLTEISSNSRRPLVGIITCPDKKTTCGDGNTCCEQSSGEYACCPYAGAVCCKDKVHCCPADYHCNVTTGKCDKTHTRGSLKQLSTVAMTTLSLLKDVQCADKKTSCPTGDTCCKMAAREYGCCPLPDAVCCSDGAHCCPSGTHCDLGSGRCLRSMPWFEKVPATPASQRTPKLGDITCPGSSATCPDGNTCCRLASGQWGCCPMPNATCCPDGQHCCPNGYRCNGSTGTCVPNQGTEEADRYVNLIKKAAGLN